MWLNYFCERENPLFFSPISAVIYNACGSFEDNTKMNMALYSMNIMISLLILYT